MKIIITAAFVLSLLSCGQPQQNQQMLAKIDSLQKQLNDTYKPGLGEFMSGIQVHHAKLYFAGQHLNWKLADFEVHEIMESLDDIQKYANDRPEAKLVPMLNPAIDSINAAITSKSLPAFNKGFVLLTNTCNSCHQAVHYEFNKVILPTAPPVPNQAF